jgi:hypothetical protein
VKYGTLGSENSNHALVLRRYLRTRAIASAEIAYYDDFKPAFEDLAVGRIDFVLQVSVHPQHAECVARYMNRVFIVDTFIAGSKPLGVLTRAEIGAPQSIALQPATRHYTDLSRWPIQIDEPSITAVAEGLLARRVDSGLTALEWLDRYPDRFRLDIEIGPVQDAWILFGRDTTRQRTLLS